jgi:probable rRNA maturation factor
MSVEITNRQKEVTVNLTSLRRMAGCVLRNLRLAAPELSILLTDDQGIQAINKTYRGVDKPTDILSFGMREHPGTADPLPPHPGILGDIVISMPAIRRQARDRKVVWQEEMQLILIHGILHLLGYNHAKRVDKLRMQSLHAVLSNLCREK